MTCQHNSRTFYRGDDLWKKCRNCPEERLCDTIHVSIQEAQHFRGMHGERAMRSRKKKV